MSDTKRNRDGKNHKKGGKGDAKKAEREEERKAKHIPRRPNEPGKITRQLERAMHVVHGADAGSFKRPAEKARIDRGRIGCKMGLLVDEKAADFITKNAVFCLGGPDGTRPEFQVRSQNICGTTVVLILDDPGYITEKLDRESNVPETAVANLAGCVTSWLFSREDYDNPATKEARFYLAPPDRYDFFATQILTAIPIAEWIGQGAEKTAPGNGEGKDFVALSDDEVLVTRRVRKDQSITVAGAQFVCRYIEGGGIRLLTLEQDTARKATLEKALPEEVKEGLEKLRSQVPATRAPQPIEPKRKDPELVQPKATDDGNEPTPQPEAPQPRSAPQATVTALNADIKRLSKRELQIAIGEIAVELQRIDTDLLALQNKRREIAGKLAAHEGVYDDLIAREHQARLSPTTEPVAGSAS